MRWISSRTSIARWRRSESQPTSKRMSNDFSTMPVARLIEGFRSRACSPVDVATAVLDRIGRLDGRLHAFTYVDTEGALTSGRQLQARWHRGQPLGALDGFAVIRP